MRYKIALMLLLAVLPIQSCANKITLKAIPSPDQMMDHKGVVTSELKHVVSLSRYEITKVVEGKLMFTIVVENYGEKPINISNENISIIFEGKNQDWISKEIRLLSPAEFTRDIVYKYIYKNNFINYFEVQHPGSPEPFDSAAGTDGYVRLDKKIKADLKSSNTSMKNHRDKVINQKRANLKYSLPIVILTPQIIMPDDSITAVFACDTSEIGDKLKGNYKITVSIDGEDYEFNFSRSYN